MQNDQMNWIRGKELLCELDYSGAIGKFTSILQSQPENSDALELRALAFFHLGDFEKSLADCNRALEISPDKAELLLQRGSTWAMLGKTDESLADLDRLLELQDDHPEGLLRRAWVHARRGEVHESQADLEHILKRIDEAPEDEQKSIRMFTAMFLLENGLELGIARELFGEVLEREPDNAVVLATRASLWRRLNLPDMAVRDLTQALEIDGQYTDWLLERAAANIETGRKTLTNSAFRRAIFDADRFLESRPNHQAENDWKAYYLRGIARFQSAQRAWIDKSGYAKAIDDFSEALLLEPRNVDVLFHRASVYWKTGRYDSAIDDCSEILRIEPEHFDALELRIRAYQKTGDHLKAQADFETIERLEQNRPTSHCAHGGCSCH